VASRPPRILFSLVACYRTRNAMLAGGLVVILAIFAASFAILQVETDPKSMIKTADDAIWWALCTITTVDMAISTPSPASAGSWRPCSCSPA